MNVHHLVWIDLEESPPKSLRDRIDRALEFGAERKLLRKFRFIRTCSPRLEGPVARTNPGAEIRTIPVGLDTSLYPFIPDERRSDGATVTLIGSMAWYPGYSAAVRLLSRLWPEIKRRVPAAKLQIVGWSARSALKDYIGMPDVEIVENVPEVQPYFDRTNVFLYAPSRGRRDEDQDPRSDGVRGSRWSRPPEGVEGLPAVDGEHAGVCEDDAGLIDRAVALLNDPARQNRQRRAARVLIESHCGPTPTIDAVENFYQRRITETQR